MKWTFDVDLGLDLEAEQAWCQEEADILAEAIEGWLENA